MTEEDGFRRRRRGFAAVVGIAVVILVLGLLTYDGLHHLDERRRLVDHTQRVIEAAEKIRDDIVDAETGQRGYLIVGNEDYLEPYHRAVKALASDTTELRRLTRDNPDQQRRIDELERLLSARLGKLEINLVNRRKYGLGSAQDSMRNNTGKALMDSVRVSIAAIEGGERALLATRSRSETEYARRVNITVGAGTLVAILLALFLARLLAASAEAQAKAARDLAEQNDQLGEQALELELQQRQLEEQTEELTAQNEELRAATDELQRQADELDAARIAAQSAQAAAEEANRAKLQFLATMSHELRTPLNAITGYADLIAIGVRGPVTDSQVDDLERIKRGSQTLLSHINDILNFAKLEAGKIEFHNADVSVGDIIAGAESLVRPQLLSKQIRFTNGCPDGHFVRGDREKIAQVLLNLLSNAQKFTGAGGEITVNCTAEDDTVRISVRDTGIGIAAEKLESIFEPFVQVDRNLTSDIHHGVGLGLAISRELARAMGGDITATSTLGAGSEFTLILPAAPAPR